MTREEYHFFLKHHCIMGNNYYVSNEHRMSANGVSQSAGEVFGYDELTRQYHERYRLPVMHTETHCLEGRPPPPNGGIEDLPWI